MRIRFSLILVLVLFSAVVFAQGGTEHHNKTGHYSFTPLADWTVRLNGADSYTYAPADGAMDAWDEKIEFSVADGEGIELNNAFDFYIKTDFPSIYGRFKLISQGQEQINGLQAKWATFTFSANGKAAAATSEGDSLISATLHALFYVIKKDNALYLVYGIAEKSFFATYEQRFRTIIRTFRYKE